MRMMSFHVIYNHCVVNNQPIRQGWYFLVFVILYAICLTIGRKRKGRGIENTQTLILRKSPHCFVMGNFKNLKNFFFSTFSDDRF